MYSSNFGITLIFPATASASATWFLTTPSSSHGGKLPQPSNARNSLKDSPGRKYSTWRRERSALPAASLSIDEPVYAIFSFLKLSYRLLTRFCQSLMQCTSSM